MVFVPGRPFQPSPLFVGKDTKPYLRVEHLKGAYLAKFQPYSLTLD
jgi:hypothetical protein